MLIACDARGTLTSIAMEEGSVTRVRRFFVEVMFHQNLTRFLPQPVLKWDVALDPVLWRYQRGGKVMNAVSKADR